MLGKLTLIDMQIIIRKAHPSDFEQIYKLNRDELGYDYSAYRTERKLIRLLYSSTDMVYVAVIKGCVVGYIHACDYDTLYAPHLKNIMGLAVSSEHRRIGVGRMLIQAIEKWAIDTGADGVRLTSGTDREGAHLFYQSMGYKKERLHYSFKKLF